MKNSAFFLLLKTGLLGFANIIFVQNHYQSISLSKALIATKY